MNDRDADDADDESWEFSLSDIEQREAEATEAAEGRLREPEPIEAGDPTLEGTLFFLLGIAFTLFVISRLFV
ncbi:hypothetical protein [Natronomonas gomsonensis]|uniref:DUF7312 domain-containing protein n=1 Tax=Natronomonas gomsonensis TaxID=1046043 RepID=UPI0015C03DB2|nr:hypothetical protein [Natronomonas gomsonensis]